MLTIKDFYPIWNALHQEHTVKGADARNEAMSLWLEDTIIEAKKAYYETGENLMEDRVYDKLEEYLKLLKPDSKVLEKVGS